MIGFDNEPVSGLPALGTVVSLSFLLQNFVSYGPQVSWLLFCRLGDVLRLMVRVRRCRLWGHDSILFLEHGTGDHELSWRLLAALAISRVDRVGIFHLFEASHIVKLPELFQVFGRLVNVPILAILDVLNIRLAQVPVGL